MDAGVLHIIRKLRDAGFEAYVVGGVPRDMLMGRQPKDNDIATSATPDDVEKLFEKTLSVGAHFGVMIVVLNGEQYEVATFRKDAAYSDGRHPDAVTFSSVREDVERRDFTINAIMYDPVEEKYLDYVGGREDIKNKIIRAIGDPQKRFEEDHLRMLRAIRFAYRFDFEIEPATWEALCKLAFKINFVSAERIGDELTKILMSPRAGKAIKAMQRCGLLKEILPEIAAMDGVEQPPQFHPEGDVLVHTCLMMDLLVDVEDRTPVLAWACLLHDVAKPPTFTVTDRIRFNGHCELGAIMATKILRRLRFSNDLIEQVEWLVENHLRICDLPKMRQARAIRFLREPGFPDLLKLNRLDTLGSLAQPINNDRYQAMYDEEMAKGPPSTPLLNGNDLIALGYKPGPTFSEILNDVETQHLENKLSSKVEAENWVKKNHPPENLQ